MAVTFVELAEGNELRVSVQFPFESVVALAVVVPIDVPDSATVPPGIPVPLTTSELLLIRLVEIVGAGTVIFTSTVPVAPAR